MAKRKRLTGPLPEISDSVPAGLETKSAIDPARRKAPIADVTGEAAATAALQAMVDHVQTARDDGRMVVELPLDDIRGTHLHRDRVALGAEDMEALKASLLKRGQQTPIEVEYRDDGYGLISGFRRLTALRELQAAGQGGDTVLALIRRPEDAAAAYTAMVEENEIRVGLSYFERASVVLRTVQAGVFATEADALKTLFAAASRAKRSKIKAFIPLVDSAGGFLKFPNALTERLGLALAHRVATDPDWTARLKDRLRKADPETAEAESTLLTKALASGQALGQPVPAPPKAGRSSAGSGRDVAPGVTLIAKAGDLRLTGPGVTPDLAEALEVWLRNTRG